MLLPAGRHYVLSSLVVAQQQLGRVQLVHRHVSGMHEHVPVVDVVQRLVLLWDGGRRTGELEQLLVHRSQRLLLVQVVLVVAQYGQYLVEDGGEWTALAPYSWAGWAAEAVQSSQAGSVS